MARWWIVRHENEACLAEWTSDRIKEDENGDPIPPKYCNDCSVFAEGEIKLVQSVPRGTKHYKPGRRKAQSSGEDLDTSVEFSCSFKSSITRRDLRDLSDNKVSEIMRTIRSLGREEERAPPQRSRAKGEG